MTENKIYPSEYAMRRLIQVIGAQPGDLAEFGVLRGDTAVRLLQAFPGRRYFAVDSFRGLDEPGEHDTPKEGEAQRYPQGRFDQGGSAEFRARLAPYGDRVTIIEGWIPAALTEMPEDARFALAYVDLDHYAPTLATLEFLKHRMATGGVILCDDVFDGNADTQRLASRAVWEFMLANRARVMPVLKEERQIAFILVNEPEEIEA